jgi:hypothetical protein
VDSMAWRWKNCVIARLIWMAIYDWVNLGSFLQYIMYSNPLPNTSHYTKSI